MPSNALPLPAPHPLFRGVGVLVLFASVIICALQAMGIAAAMSAADHAPLPVMLVPPLLILIGGIAVSAVLEGVARLVVQVQPEHPDPTNAIAHLTAVISQLDATLPTLIAAPPMEQPVYQSDEATAAAPPDTSTMEQYLERVLKTLEEMKELSMLDDTQRQSRKKDMINRRKLSRLEEAARLIQQHNWEQADALLHLLESLHPGDSEILAKRNELDDARILIQAEEWDALNHQTEDLLALSRFTQAMQAISQFLERYPHHTDGQQLSQRVQNEWQIYTDRNSGQLYEEIKVAVEARQWRNALAGIQKFLELYPENTRATRIRQQVRVIQKNAEIEERHEQEDRIRDLITSRNYAEAADLSEDLLQRFPDSPQAGYLTELLPKLRQRTPVEAQNAIAE